MLVRFAVPWWRFPDDFFPGMGPPPARSLAQITRHVAEIVSRQEFILKLARAMMMFGGPTHRLQAQMQAAGKVLDTPLSCMYLPDVMLISFEDQSTSTSSIKFIRQGSALDIGKLQEANELYWKVRARGSRHGRSAQFRT